MLGIEQIDITGSGNNTLTLNQREVLNLSGESNTLIVRRNVGDVVNIGSGWTQVADETIGPDTFNVYLQGAASLKVAVDTPNADFIAIRQGVINGLVLRNITIPASGSGAALPRVGSGGNGAPPVSPFASGSSSIMLSCIADSMSETKASKMVDISDESGNAVGRFQIADDFFTDLDRQFRRTK